MPIRGENLLGLSLFFDANLIGDNRPAVALLRRLHENGCVAIRVADALATEQAEASDELREKLSEEAASYPEAFGVLVLGHSRLGSTVLGGEADATLMAKLRKIMRPDITDWAQARKQHVRDVMHVHTAIRYAADAFVTRDHGILWKAEALSDYISVWSPEHAGRTAIKRLRNYQKRQR